MPENTDTGQLSDAAIEAKRSYYRQYRQSHKAQLNAYHKRWCKQHPTDRAEQIRRYWERKAAKNNTDPSD